MLIVFPELSTQIQPILFTCSWEKEDFRLVGNINTDETLEKLFQTDDVNSVLEILADYFNELL